MKIINSYGRLETIIIFLCVAYALVVFSISAGLWRSRGSRTLNNSESVRLSVIIACRNEEKTIPRLLESLARQVLPGGLSEFEVIVVDDHSTDDTAVIVRKFSGLQGLKLLRNEQSPGKKGAIQTGINASSGELILLTDGDCVVPSRWIAAMLDTWLRNRDSCTMVLGGVIPFRGRTLVSRIQFVEMALLMGVTQGSSGLGMPVLCNGANMLISRAAWETVVPPAGTQRYASGDDMFLMEAFSRRFGGVSIVFCAETAAIVSTEPVNTLKAFLLQRFRWVSKSPGYRSPAIVATAVLIYLLNAVLATGYVFLLFSTAWLWPLFALWGLKCLVDLPLVMGMLVKNRRIGLLWLYLPLQLAGPVYILVTGILGLFLTVSWKGRSIFN